MKRKHSSIIALMIALCMVLSGMALTRNDVGTAQAATVYEDLFEKDSVIDIKINVSESDFESMLADPTAEEYKSANVTVDGVSMENVGFRTKGNLTLNSVAKSDSDRYSFRIKFDKYVDGQNLLGLDELVVNNMYSDPSYMREYLSYEALREIGSPAPLAVFANIYINDELYGFYLCVEAEDNSFLERNFGSDEGNLYKQESPSSLVYEEGSDYPKSELKVGDDESKIGLSNMIKVLNGMPEGEKGDIESVLDVDSALQYIAANTVLGNYDSYNGNMMQNYYLYEQDGKFTVIPWDYNMSIGGFQGGTAAQTIPIDEPVYGISMESVPLINNLLAVDEYKEKYHGYIQDLLDYLQNFEERVNEVATIIRPYVQADPSKFVTMEQFEASFVYSETTQGTDPAAGAGGMQPPTDGNMPQMPQDGQMPADIQGGGPMGQNDRTSPQQGGQNGQMAQGGMGGRQGGMGGGMMSGGSIITFIKNRVANIEKQLSGELPTTGNTTMNNRGMVGGGPMGQRPGNNTQDNGGATAQQSQITVKLNGAELTFDQQPVIQNGRTLVPLRAIFEALGATLEWDEATQTITATKDDTVIKLVVGQTTAYKNGETITLDVAPTIIGGRTLVPVRFIAESFNLTVEWDSATNTVIINQ